MMKKKIFFVMSTDDFSGAEAVNFNIIDALKEKYDFFWVSKKGNINNFLKDKNIKWIELKKFNAFELKKVISIYKPDILHATDFKSSIICSIAKKNGVYVISHLHHNAPWLSKFNLKSLLYFLFSYRIDKVLTVSDSIEKEYIFSSLIHKKIDCIYNPISVDNVKKMVKKDDYIKKYDICCVARLELVKDPMRFISIISSLKKDNPYIKCIWVGKGSLESECKEEIIRRNLKDNIEFVGFKKNPFKYMASSKVFLLTSKWEGFGLVAFEALSLGLPCFVSNVGGLPTIVNNECGFLCESDDDFINSIKNVLSDDHLYKKLSNNAIERSKKIDNFSEYISFIDRLYSNNGSDI